MADRRGRGIAANRLRSRRSNRRYPNFRGCLSSPGYPNSPPWTAPLRALTWRYTIRNVQWILISRRAWLLCEAAHTAIYFGMPAANNLSTHPLRISPCKGVLAAQADTLKVGAIL